MPNITIYLDDETFLAFHKQDTPTKDFIRVELKKKIKKLLEQ